MLFKAIALSAALLASSAAAEDDGLIRMKLSKVPDHEIVAQHLKAEVRFTQTDVVSTSLFLDGTNTVAPSTADPAISHPHPLHPLLHPVPSLAPASLLMGTPPT